MKRISLLLALLAVLPLHGSGFFGGSGTPEGTAVKSTGQSSGLVLTSNGSNGASWGSVAGTGDVVGPASSVDGEIVLYSGTTGKAIKRASGTGICKATSGVATFATLVNADVSATAAIAYSKLATVTASKGLCSDSSGFVSACASGPSTTEMSYLAGVTSALQTQLNAKLPAASPTATGTFTMPSGSITSSAWDTGTSSLKANGVRLDPTIQDEGNSGASITIDLATYQVHKVTLTAATTFTLSNPVVGVVYVFQLATNGSGPWVITWPGTVKWPAGTAPTTSAANKTDIITLLWDGTSYYGNSALNF